MLMFGFVGNRTLRHLGRHSGPFGAMPWAVDVAMRDDKEFSWTDLNMAVTGNALLKPYEALRLPQRRLKLVSEVNQNVMDWVLRYVREQYPDAVVTGTGTFLDPEGAFGTVSWASDGNSYAICGRRGELIVAGAVGPAGGITIFQFGTGQLTRRNFGHHTTSKDGVRGEEIEEKRCLTAGKHGQGLGQAALVLASEPSWKHLTYGTVQIPGRAATLGFTVLESVAAGQDGVADQVWLRLRRASVSEIDLESTGCSDKIRRQIEGAMEHGPFMCQVLSLGGEQDETAALLKRSHIVLGRSRNADDWALRTDDVAFLPGSCPDIFINGQNSVTAQPENLWGYSVLVVGDVRDLTSSLRDGKFRRRVQVQIAGGLRNLATSMVDGPPRYDVVAGDNRVRALLGYVRQHFETISGHDGLLGSDTVRRLKSLVAHCDEVAKGLADQHRHGAVFACFDEECILEDHTCLQVGDRLLESPRITPATDRTLYTWALFEPTKDDACSESIYLPLPSPLPAILCGGSCQWRAREFAVRADSLCMPLVQARSLPAMAACTLLRCTGAPVARTPRKSHVPGTVRLEMSATALGWCIRCVFPQHREHGQSFP
jgi:hypothetical protein